MAADEIEPTPAENRLRIVTSILAIGLFGIWVLLYLYGLYAIGRNGVFAPILESHFKATVGLPLAALAALCLVFLLRATSGPIELEVLGFKFKGASGPLIMWVVVFLAIVLAIQTLWKDKGEKDETPVVREKSVSTDTHRTRAILQTPLNLSVRQTPYARLN